MARTPWPCMRCVAHDRSFVSAREVRASASARRHIDYTACFAWLSAGQRRTSRRSGLPQSNSVERHPQAQVLLVVGANVGGMPRPSDELHLALPRHGGKLTSSNRGMYADQPDAVCICRCVPGTDLVLLMGSAHSLRDGLEKPAFIAEHTSGSTKWPGVDGDYYPRAWRNGRPVPP